MSEELGTELLSQLNPEDQQEVQHDTVDSCRHKPNFQMSVYFAPNTFDLLIGKSLFPRNSGIPFVIKLVRVV